MKIVALGNKLDPFLRSLGVEAYFANERDIKTIMEEGDVGLIIVDELSCGVDVIEKIRAFDKSIKVLLLSKEHRLDTALKAMRYGVTDYLTYDNKDEIKRYLEEITPIEQKEFPGLGELIGASQIMRELFKKILECAETDSTVFIQGESGTGKELVARTIHKYSKRNTHQFVAINCSAIPQTLLESELFGYVKGAFSGALKDKEGLFRTAHGGTILLDEVLDMPTELQVKLLRALQEKEIRPVGSTKTYKIDVRVMAATNRNLERALLTGKLREDFFYRLYVIPITVPPLRERKEDIPLLAEYFIHQLNQRKYDRKKIGIKDEAMEILMRYNYPGNVRELQNIIERAFALGKGDYIEVNDLPKEIIEKAGYTPMPKEREKFVFEKKAPLKEKEEIPLTPREEKILKAAQKLKKFQLHHIKELLPDISEKTIRNTLRSLTQKSILQHTGSTKNSTYILIYPKYMPKISESIPENLNYRQRKMVVFLRENRVGKMEDFRKLFPDTTPRTLLNDLIKLCEMGFLERHGEKKGTYYILKRELPE